MMTEYYAILIGINHYPNKPLHGCIQDVQDIREYLEQTIHPINAKVYASVDQPNGLMRSPTCKNVIAALLKVKSEAKGGDFVYIHFSGHGTRGSPDGEFSELSTGDLGLVLLNEKDKSKEDYLWGTRLGPLLNGMVRKGLIVTLVLDCCFAATVYRRDDNVRFFHCNTNQASNIVNTEESSLEVPKLATGLRTGRDASMRPNWLIDPNGYAILAACGPDQEATEVKVDGRVHGALSFHLRKSFNEPGGCARNHGTIYRRLLAAFHEHSMRQNPERFGNPDQGFFGQPSYHINKALIHISKKTHGHFQLQAGQAHGVRDGDQFELYPPDFDFRHACKGTAPQATILRAGSFSSDLELSDTSLVLDLAGWNGIGVTYSSLQAYPLLLESRLQSEEEWVKTLMKHSISITTEPSENTSFRILVNEQNEYEIRNGWGDDLKNMPTMPINHTDINYAAEIIAHLIRFTMVRDLTNAVCPSSFRETFNVQMMDHGRKSSPGEKIEVQNGQSVELLIRNLGNTPLYFTCLDLRPSWQIINLVKRSYWSIPPKDGKKGFLDELKKSIKMTVPTDMLEKGYQECDDFIKIFVMSRPTLFEVLEMPTLGQVLENKRASQVDGHRGGSILEDWDTLTFHIHVLLGNQ
jgi:hypothetical protein